MTEYVVAYDKLFGIEADSAEAAEEELARRLREGEIEPSADHVNTYEEVPPNNV